MGTGALLEVTPLALALLVAGAPVLLVPVALVTKRSPGIGALFLLGWVSGVLAVGLLVILIGDLAESGRRAPDWWGWVLATLGIVLVVLAVRKWRARVGPGEDPETPAWMERIEVMTGPAACGLGFLLVAANPKNLALVAAGGAVIVESTSRPAEQAVALVWFALVGSLGVAVPVLLPLVLGDRAGPVLAAVDAWLTRYAGVVVAVVLVVLGVVLVTRGMADLGVG